MPVTNFRFSNQGLTNADIDDIFINKESFSSYFPATPAGVWVWGCNAYASLGLASPLSAVVGTSSPVQNMASGTSWNQISSAGRKMGVVKNDGTLWMWGFQWFGALGNNINTTTTQSSPVQTVSTGTNWAQVSIGGSTTGAVKTDGTLWMWGYNGSGQLGNNDRIHRSSPVQTVATGTNWRQISVGCYGVGAVKTDGTLWRWSVNGNGSLGDNSIVGKSSPVQTVATGTNWKCAVSGCGFAAGIKTDGTLWLWGFGPVLGINNQFCLFSSPVQTIATGTNWKTIDLDKSSGSGMAVAVKTDGTLWVWGSAQNGALGINNCDQVLSPIQTQATGNNWRCATTAKCTVAAVKTDGTLWIWGRNNHGALGIQSTTIAAISSPIQTIATGTNWRSVSVGGADSYAPVIGALRG